MGKEQCEIDKIKFTLDHIQIKELVINMLKYEDQLMFSDVGKSIYNNYYYYPTKSLDAVYTLHRIVLNEFDFDTSDESVDNYRKIFSYYYKSPIDYDIDVLSSVFYMRENKCVYYKSPMLKIGDTLPNCRLYELNGKSETNIYDQLGNNFRYGFIAGFSIS